jgi:hypothetical protein
MSFSIEFEAGSGARSPRFGIKHDRNRAYWCGMNLLERARPGPALLLPMTWVPTFNSLGHDAISAVSINAGGSLPRLRDADVCHRRSDSRLMT